MRAAADGRQPPTRRHPPSDIRRPKSATSDGKKARYPTPVIRRPSSDARHPTAGIRRQKGAISDGRHPTARNRAGLSVVGCRMPPGCRMSRRQPGDTGVASSVPTVVPISSRPAFPASFTARIPVRFSRLYCLRSALLIVPPVFSFLRHISDFPGCYLPSRGLLLTLSRFASYPVVAQVPPALRPSSLRRSPRAFPCALRVPAQEPSPSCLPRLRAAPPPSRGPRGGARGALPAVFP